jgi:lysophospholipase L1-like esterase
VLASVQAAILAAHDTEAERETFIPARLSDPALKAASDAQYAPLGAISDVEAPIIPPATTLANVGESVWFGANSAIAMRFVIERSRTVQRFRLPCAVASGNIELGIYAATRTGNNTFDFSRVATTGVIPCPTPSGSIIEVNLPTPVRLLPGQYAVYLWCDNVTATFSHTLSNAINRAGWAFGSGSASAGGMPASLASLSYGGRAFAVTLEAAIPTRRPAALLGDSITQNQQWFTLANGATGTRYTATNFGVAGETSSQIKARVAAALAGSPKVLSVLAGTNDLGVAAPTSAAIIANLTAIYAQAKTAGSTVLACTITPRNFDGAQTPLNAAQIAALNETNAWIRAQAGPQVKIVDWTVQLSTGDGVTPNLTYFSDHVHPNSAGAVVMAGVLDDVLASIP